MKKYLLLLLILTSNTYADIEVLGGGLTYHIIDNGTAPYYSYKLSKDGRLIANPMVGITYTQHDSNQYSLLCNICGSFRSHTVFYGRNSVGTEMPGGLYSAGVECGNFQVGTALGGYVQESHFYTDRGIHSFRATNIQGMDIVPILGIVLNYKINLRQDYYLKLNNLISPVILNSTLAVGKSF